jgi:hypothetical protein
MAARRGERAEVGGRAPGGDRVERIREALEEGCYLVDGRAVAGKILEREVASLRCLPRLREKGDSGLFSLSDGAAAEFLWGGFPSPGDQTK